jgi:F0F1-type ATP synthase assembly protein I
MADEEFRPKDEDTEAIEARLQRFEDRLREIGDPSQLTDAELAEAEDLLQKLGYTPSPDEDVAVNFMDARLEQLQQKANELEHSARMPDFDPEFDERLKNLEARVNQSQQRRRSKSEQTERTLKSDREAARGLGVGLSVAYMIIGLPLVGYGIGYLIDRQTGNTVASGLLTVLGAALGVGMAVWTVNRSQR